MNEIVIVPSEKYFHNEAFKNYLKVPDFDILYEEDLEPSWEIRSKRLIAFKHALEGKLKAVATLRALLHFIIPPQELERNIFNLKIGDEFKLTDKDFTKMGYKRVFNVREGGTFAIRGEIIDFIGPDNIPYRIELYDNLIEEIRQFDVNTQKSVKKLEYALLMPAREYLTDEDDKVSVYSGRYVSSTILDYNVRLYVVERQKTIENFVNLEREILKAIESNERKLEYRNNVLFSYVDLISKAENIEISLGLETHEIEEPQSLELAGLITEEELQPGDIVVHKKYGIAQFVEIKKVETAGKIKEFLLLRFSDSFLYVPIERIDLVDKYVGESSAVKLDSLKKNTWIKRVNKVRKNIEEIVKDLVLIHHARQYVNGVILEGNEELEKEFADTFEYIETEDQIKAIEEVFEDLRSTKPMDRLLVGDSGYGKTEVAIRALFRTVVSGKQGVLLAPTTILAQQHYENIKKRMEPFGVRVALLNRLSTDKEKKEMLENVKNGKIDILVGTHSILNNVVFADLGLVVIDEEQRFGVEQKEKLKKLRVNVNVLSMSATPIPRTLNMAFSKLKDLSEIKTPPFGRKEIQVNILPYNENTIKIAIIREVNRGGQVLYVHNRVNTLPKVYERLKELVPEIKIGIVHGQESKRELKRNVELFYKGELDLLLATTVIESGIDVPKANTIIVDDAHRYGLAQLYQLRGRVGRSDKLAFAYFLYPKSANSKVIERLWTIKKYVGPGSGMKIAMADMEIRGVGSVFGLEQHGNINDVGLNYYLEMLDDVLAQVTNSEKIKSKLDVELEGITESIYIPEEYIFDPFERLRFYRRIAAEVEPEKLVEIMNEMQDRFGKLPKSVLNLFKYAVFRIALSRYGVKRLRLSDINFVVEFEKGKFHKFTEKYTYNEKDNVFIFYADVESFVNELVGEISEDIWVRNGNLW